MSPASIHRWSMTSSVLAHARCTRTLARITVAAALLCASAGSPAVALDSPILFARGAPVPTAVRQFAWRVIEERCDYQSWERSQRSFWAYDTRARALDEGTVYSIRILSDVAWKKAEPTAYIEMTIVADHQIRLTALTSSFHRLLALAWFFRRRPGGRGRRNYPVRSPRCPLETSPFPVSISAPASHGGSRAGWHIRCCLSRRERRPS